MRVLFPNETASPVGRLLVQLRYRIERGPDGHCRPVITWARGCVLDLPTWRAWARDGARIVANSPRERDIVLEVLHTEPEGGQPQTA